MSEKKKDVSKVKPHWGPGLREIYGYTHDCIYVAHVARHVTFPEVNLYSRNKLAS